MRTEINSIDSIVFQDDDTLQQTLTKIVQINAGSHRLKTELTKLNINYVRVDKGANVTYILRGAKIGVINCNTFALNWANVPNKYKSVKISQKKI